MSSDAHNFSDILSQYVRKDGPELKEMRDAIVALQESNNRTERYLVGGFDKEGTYQPGVRDQLNNVLNAITQSASSSERTRGTIKWVGGTILVALITMLCTIVGAIVLHALGI